MSNEEVFSPFVINLGNSISLSGPPPPPRHYQKGPCSFVRLKQHLSDRLELPGCSSLGLPVISARRAGRSLCGPRGPRGEGSLAL